MLGGSVVVVVGGIVVVGTTVVVGATVVVVVGATVVVGGRVVEVVSLAAPAPSPTTPVLVVAVEHAPSATIASTDPQAATLATVRRRSEGATT
jgi:hypothetical protein